MPTSRTGSKAFGKVDNYTSRGFSFWLYRLGIGRSAWELGVGIEQSACFVALYHCYLVIMMDTMRM
jgi:hypothetical protein